VSSSSQHMPPFGQQPSPLGQQKVPGSHESPWVPQQTAPPDAQAIPEQHVAPAKHAPTPQHTPPGGPQTVPQQSPPVGQQPAILVRISNHAKGITWANERICGIWTRILPSIDSGKIFRKPIVVPRYSIVRFEMHIALHWDLGNLCFSTEVYWYEEPQQMHHILVTIYGVRVE
jgi:hypothetical protein